MSGTRGLKPISEIAERYRKRSKAGRPVQDLHAAFHLAEGVLKTRRKNDVLFLYTEDRAVRFAMTGMEGEILGWLHRNGHEDIRGIAWSAE